MTAQGKANYEGYYAAMPGASPVPFDELPHAERLRWDGGACSVELWLSELPVDEDMPGNEPAKVIIVTEAGGYRRRYELPDFGQLHGGELILGRKQDGGDVKVEVMYPPGEWKHVARDGAEVPDGTKWALDVARQALTEIVKRSNDGGETPFGRTEIGAVAGDALNQIFAETEL